MTHPEFPHGGRTLPAPVLVGRAREQAQLREHLSGALAGRGSLTLIGGEAGIGKTALAEALTADATARGALVLVGYCYDQTETPPYGPWTDLLNRCPALPELPPRPVLLSPAGPDGLPESQAARFARLRDFLAATAAARPVVLVIEDLHWADPANLDLLRFLARELAGAGLLLLVTYRSEELHRRHPLYSLLPNLVREARADRIDLHPLGDDDVRALVRACHALTGWDEARLVAHLHDRAGGNPFYAGELLRALREEGILRPAPADGDGNLWMLGNLAAARVPALLRQVIDGRLMRLGEDAYRLLGLAATIGLEAPLTLWRAVGDVADERLADVVERAVAAHLLRETVDGRGVRFAHALIREALYEGVPLPRRQAWHRGIGEALLTSPAPDPDTVASHLRQADDARAADWLIRAGERAQRSYAWTTAIERFTAGLALLDAQDADRAQRAWLRVRLGLLLRYTDPPRAVAMLAEARSLSAGAGEAVLVAAVTCYAGHVRCWAGDMSGVHEMEDGVAALDALSVPDRARFAGLLADGTTGVLADDAVPQATLAQWLAIVGRYAEARHAADAVLAGEPDGDPARSASSASFYDACQALGYVNTARGRPRDARRYWRRSQASLRALGHHVMLRQQLYADVNSAVLPYPPDCLAERARLAADLDEARHGARGIWREEDEPGCLALWFIEGRWADIRRMTSFPESFRTLDVSQNPAVAALARAQGDEPLAWRLVRDELPRGPETAPGTARRFLSAVQLQRLASSLALDVDALDAARGWLEAHDQWLAWSGAVLGRAEGQLAWAEYERAAGDTGAAWRRAEQSLSGAMSPRQPLVLLAAYRLLGDLDTATGRYVEATHHLAQALALADACAAPYERALTLLRSAALHIASGERDTAWSPLTEARALFADLDARPALARADALASALGQPAVDASTSSTELAGLSSREIEVLRLVARGLSNAQVAAQLSRSPRTVNTHLTTIYSKLGVSSRGSAIRFALDHDLR